MAIVVIDEVLAVQDPEDDDEDIEQPYRTNDLEVLQICWCSEHKGRIKECHMHLL